MRHSFTLEDRHKVCSIKDVAQRNVVHDTTTYLRHSGPVTVLVLQNRQLRKLVWFAPELLPYRLSETLVLERTRVQQHKLYRGSKQMVSTSVIVFKQVAGAGHA